VALALAAAAIATGAGPAAAPACAQSDSAVVVVRDSRGVEREECVALPGPEISSVEFLRLAGFDVVTRDYGGNLGEAVCSLNGDGTPASDCPSASGHWHLWLFADGTWNESIEGASSTEVEPGSVQGWTWSTTGSNAPPPAPTPDRRCGDGPRIGLLPPPRDEESDDGPGPVVPLLVGTAAVGLVGFAIRRKRQHS
jgi:hypothetical protein